MPRGNSGDMSMSKSAKSRVDWQCPVCERTFRIPGTRPRPQVCPECQTAREPQKSAAASAKSGPLSEVPSDSGSPFESPTPTSPRTSARTASTSKDEQPLYAQEGQEILEHLANISRTMTFFRRLVWGMVFAMILNIVLMGIGVFYAMQQVGSLQGILQVPAPAPARPQAAGQPAAMPPADGIPLPGEAIEKIGEYSQTVRGLVNELQNQ